MAALQAERKLAAQIAANESWAFTADRSARTANGRAAFRARFYDQVDPLGTMDPAERHKRAEHLRRAYFQRLALKSAKARAARAVVAEGEQADAELASLGAVTPSGRAA